MHERAYTDPDDGNITDGDDHIWIGNLAILKGGGGWRDFDLEKQQGKRTHADLLEGGLPVAGTPSNSLELEGPPTAVARCGDNDDERIEQVSFSASSVPSHSLSLIDRFRLTDTTLHSDAEPECPCC